LSYFLHDYLINFFLFFTIQQNTPWEYPIFTVSTLAALLNSMKWLLIKLLLVQAKFSMKKCLTQPLCLNFKWKFWVSTHPRTSTLPSTTFQNLNLKLFPSMDPGSTTSSWFYQVRQIHISELFTKHLNNSELIFPCITWQPNLK